MQFSKEQIEKASSAASAEELLAMAKADGIELTEEEAKHYYDVLHEEALFEEQLRTLSEEELANVSGGSQCKGGKTYSSDYPYYLIVTHYNSCPHYKEGEDLLKNPGDSRRNLHDRGEQRALKGTCPHCEYCLISGIVTYCKERTADNDPWR